jgi:hypothetical protein
MSTEPDAVVPEEGGGASASGGKKSSFDLGALMAGELDVEYGHDDFTPVREIKPRSPEWYWRQRVVKNDLNILAGTQGLGKSQVATAIASEATQRGEVVLVISAEDSPETTIVPRLISAGAIRYSDERGDLIQIWKQGRPWDLDDAKKLQEYIYRFEASLVIIDPVAAFVTGKTDTYKDAHVRSLLAPLRSIAEDQGCTLLAVMHLKKGMEQEAVNSIGGSIAWTAAPRSVLILTRDPGGDRATDRILWHAKCNVGPEQPALACTVEGVDQGELGDWNSSFIRWGDERPDLDITAALAPREDSRSKRPSPALDAALTWLKEQLEDGEWHLSQELNEAAAAAGHAKRTFEKARTTLGVEAKNLQGVWSVRWAGARGRNEDRKVTPGAAP